MTSMQIVCGLRQRVDICRCSVADLPAAHKPRPGEGAEGLQFHAEHIIAVARLNPAAMLFCHQQWPHTCVVGSLHL
jgi:hypothetical protein